MNLNTTEECLKAAEDVLSLAKQVSTRQQHATVWDMKVNVMRAVDSALETGFYTGEAYSELTQAKRLLVQAETIAGQQSQETYMK